MRRPPPLVIGFVLGGAVLLGFGFFDAWRIVSRSGVETASHFFKVGGGILIVLGLWLWVFRARDRWLSVAAGCAGVGLVFLYGGVLFFASDRGQWLVALGIAALGLSLFGLAPRGRRRLYASLLVGLSLGSAVVIAGRLGLLSELGLAGRNQWTLVGMSIAGLTLVIWTGVRFDWTLAAAVFFMGLGTVVLVGGLFGEFAEAPVRRVTGAQVEGTDLAEAVAATFRFPSPLFPEPVSVSAAALEAPADETTDRLREALQDFNRGKELADDAIISGTLVVGFALALWAFYITRRWAWLLGISATTLAVGMVAMDNLWVGTPLAIWAGGIVAVEALLVAAYTFSRMTLRWVALVVLVAVAMVLVRISVTREANAAAAAELEPPGRQIRLVAEADAEAPVPAAGRTVAVRDPVLGPRLVELIDLPDPGSLVVSGDEIGPQPLSPLLAASIPTGPGSNPLLPVGRPPGCAGLALVVDADGRGAFVCADPGVLVFDPVDRAVGLVRSAEVFLVREDDPDTVDDESGVAHLVAGHIAVLGEPVPDASLALLVDPRAGGIASAGGAPVGGGEVLVVVDVVAREVRVPADDLIAGSEDTGLVVAVDPDSGAAEVPPAGGAGAEPGPDGEPGPDEQPDPPDFTARAREGAEAVAADVIEATTGTENTTTLGPVAWVVLGLLALVGYRRLEIINGRRIVGPIAIESVEVKEDPDLWKSRMANMIATEVHHPADVPAGAISSETLSGVLTSTLPDATGKTAAAIAKLVESGGFPIRGLVVRAVHVRAEAAPGAGRSEEHRVTANIADRRTGETVDVRTIVRGDIESAFRGAAYAVVQSAIDRSRTTPVWAQWKSSEASGLAAYHEVIEAPEIADAAAYLSRVREQIVRLEEARSLSPGNALIRLELAQRYSLTDQLLVALSEFLTVRNGYPRQLLARYRLAATLDMVGTDLVDRWLVPGGDAARLRREIVDQFDMAGAIEKLRRDHGFRSDLEAEGREELLSDRSSLIELMQASSLEAGDMLCVKLALLHLARMELEAMRRLLSLPIIVFHSLAQSERRYWRLLLSNRRVLTWERSKVKVARRKLQVSILFAKVSERDPALREANWRDRGSAAALDDYVDHVVDVGDSGWVAHYNAACFYTARMAIDQELDVDALREVVAASLVGRDVDLSGVPAQLRWADQTGPFRSIRRWLARRRVEKAWGPKGSELRQDDLKQKALRMLRKAVSDPHSGFKQPPLWLGTDPDLELLRGHADFEALLRVLVPGQPEPVPDSGEEKT